ncbi:MAG: hypothetical protein HRU25_17080 [Psychrobium sp.]|nr:hypothetical protein [Psychrobium sp.]
MKSGKYQPYFCLPSFVFSLKNKQDLVEISATVYRKLEQDNPAKAAEFIAQSKVKDALLKSIARFEQYIAENENN